MKATLEFDLPEEAREHLIAVQAPGLYSTLTKLDGAMRGWIKYDTFPPGVETVEDLVRYIRTDIGEAFFEMGLWQ